MYVKEDETYVCLMDGDRCVYKARHKMKPNERLIYVASPLSAPTPEGIRENMRKARHYMDVAAHCRDFNPLFKDKIRVPYAPHAFVTEHLDDMKPEERALGIEFCNHMLKHASILVWCGDTISEGMQNEIDMAREDGKPIFHLPLKACCEA